MQPFKVEIVSSSFGLIELMNIIIFALTLIVAIWNFFYSIKRNKDLDNRQKKFEEKTLDREKQIHLISIKSFWFREVFLNSIIDITIEIESEILEALRSNEKFIQRKKCLFGISSLIADTIYTKGTDPKLIKVLVKYTEELESKFFGWSRADYDDEKNVRNECTEYKSRIINTLYEYEKNDYNIL